MNRITFGLLLALITSISLPATAQMATVEGKYNVPLKQKNWKKVSSKYFDVHFYSMDPVQGTLAARFAEEALFEVSRLFDYKNRSRFALMIYMSPYDLARSARHREKTTKEGGITPFREKAGSVIFPGNQQKFRERIREEVTRLLMNDFYFGGSIQTTIQNSVLLHIPDWFGEGMPAFVGEGWTFEDEMYISSLAKSNLLSYALDGEMPTNRTVRKSIWYYITSTYGKEKLSEIYYMTRLTRSVEAGIIHVLGIPLRSLTERWREFLLQRVTENETFRDALQDKASRIKLDKKDRLLGYALNPAKPEVGMLISNQGRQRLEIRNLQTEKTKTLPITPGIKTDQLDRYVINQPMAWSKDGKYLLATFLGKKEEMIFLYDMDAEKGYEKTIKPGLERIYSLAWSNDGKKVVASGLRNGQVDLFTFAPGSNRFTNLTNDIYDDQTPVWSLDDQTVFYASNRNSDTLEIEKFNFDQLKLNSDLYQIQVKNGPDRLRRITYTPEYNEYPVSAASSFELIYLTDRIGILNLEKRNVFLGDSSHLSNITIGVKQPEIGDSLLTFVSPYKGENTLWFAAADDFMGEVVVLNTRLRLIRHKQRRQAINARRLKQRADSLRQVREKQKEESLKTVPVKSDTNKTSKNVKFYVFDEDEDEDAQKPRSVRKQIRAKLKQKRKKGFEKPDFSEAEVSGVQSSGKNWSPGHLTTLFGWDPIFRLNMLLEVSIHDFEYKNKVTVGYRPFIDLKSADYYIRYDNAKNRLNWYSQLSRSSRWLNREGFSLRYDANWAEAGLAYPLNRYTQLEGGVHLGYLKRNTLDLLVPDQVGGDDVVTGLELRYTWNRTKKSGSFIKQGSWFQGKARNAYSFNNGGHQFATITGDFRQYLPVFNSIVFAGRVVGGGSFGPGGQRFFMGGVDNWFFGRFNNIDDLPIDGAMPEFFYMQNLTPVRGFQFNARNGTKFGAANLEMRIPVTRILTRNLNSGPTYNMELIPFVDVGTVWESGNPLSQKNPIDTKEIDSYPINVTVQTLKSPFLIGFGGGLRMMLLGYSMRFDLAWGVEDYTILSPRLHLSLGKNF